MPGSGGDRVIGSATLKLVAGAWLLALLLVAAYLLVGADPNAGLLLIPAAVLAGVGLLRILVAVLQLVDGAQSGVWGYFQETVVLVLLLAALVAPWRVEVALAHAAAIFGWQVPLALLAALGLVPSLARGELAIGKSGQTSLAMTFRWSDGSEHLHRSTHGGLSFLISTLSGAFASQPRSRMNIRTCMFRAA